MSDSEEKTLPKRIQVENLPCVFPNAAGLDIGSAEIVAALPPGRADTIVCGFPTFTADLERLVSWLLQHGVDTVAMESTGIYWVPIYEMLEQAGIRPFLVNPCHFKIVPGRKSDYNDAQWLQKLHSLGLLQGSFRPDNELCVLRCLLRHRAQLIEHRSPHILHMQKALKLMNIQLSEVLGDVTGVTGMAIIRAIVAGERRGEVLAQLRRPGCKNSPDVIGRALTGDWRPEHLFVLQQSLDLYDYYTQKIAECDEQIERQFSSMKPRFDIETDPPTSPGLPREKPGSHSKNKPGYNARGHLLRIIGVDLVAVTGISESIALTIISEIGTDMSRFPTCKHFCSWLHLAPHHDISGGKILRSHVLKGRNRANQAIRLAARSCARSKSVFGTFYRSVAARSSGEQAIVATAHKIARTLYHMLSHRAAFDPSRLLHSDSKRRDNERKKLEKRAKALGFTLQPCAAGPR
jgi:transposase